MEEILYMLEKYKEDTNSLDSPDICVNVFTFLEHGLESAELIDSRRSDPSFSYGSDKTYLCRNNLGQSMTIRLWGNTDGWGIFEVKSE